MSKLNQLVYASIANPNNLVIDEESIPTEATAFNQNLDPTFALAFGSAPNTPEEVKVEDAMNLFYACAEVRRGV